MRVFSLFSHSARSVDADSVVDEKALDAKAGPSPPITTVPTIVVSTPSSIVKAPSNPAPETPPTPRPTSRPAHDQQKKPSILSTAFLKCAQVSDKRAKKSALIVHDLIIGPSTAPPHHASHARPQLRHLKSQLMEPKSANKVIAHLRALPASLGSSTSQPIHAVSLASPDAEIQKLHFSSSASRSKDSADGPSFLNGLVSLDEVSSMFSNMNIVDLISHPSLGIGEPGDGPGLLAGAVPTAETVLRGFEKITPQLMALGYATGRSVVVDHTGVYPPTDRMSVLTYWWGLELVLPPPSLKHLASAQSIAGTLINFLTALALINNGVRELLPFVRYISQFIDYEFGQITQQDRGEGVVCAATWIMPAALVPRPWDFASPPPPSPSAPAPAPAPATDTPSPSPASAPAQPIESPPSNTNTNAPPTPTTTTTTTTTAPAPAPAPAVPTPPQPQPALGIIPPSLTNFADSIVGTYQDSVVFQPEVASATKTQAASAA